MTKTKKFFTSLLKVTQKISDLSRGKAAHAQLIKGSPISSCFLQNNLLNVYLKCGDFDSAHHLFGEMTQRNVVSWSSLIAGLVRCGLPGEGLRYFIGMCTTAVRPNQFTLVSVLNACSFTGSMVMFQVYALVVRLGFEWNVFVVNAFLTSLIRHGCLTDAQKVFDECLVKDTVSWNTMIEGYSRLSPSGVPCFLLRMLGDGVMPDGFTFSTVLNGLAALGDSHMGIQIHGLLVKCGHGGETCVANSLVDMYLKFGDLNQGFKAFGEVTSKDVVSWITMASGCISCGASSKTLQLVRDMRMSGINMNNFGLATVLNACANLTCIEEGKKTHGLRIKLGSESDLCIDNALVDMYSKCGFMDDAVKVFQCMHDRTIVTWTTMVMGFAKNGQSLEALEIFDEMVSKGVEPTAITFVCVLYACSQGGFVEHGWKYFSLMTQQYAISPGEDHYACMVDVLGRAGQIREAEEFISKMPFQPGPLIWQTLLGACHIHGDIEAGKRAAENVMHIDHKRHSPYVLLSNLLVGFSHWDGAKVLRDTMKTRNLNKMPGNSSLTSMDIT